MHPLPVRVSGRGAPCGRLFRFGLRDLFIPLLFCAISPAAAVPSCLPDTASRPAIVLAVVDGDTLRLDDGHLVRLIGIDTPELGRDGAPAAPFAVAAQAALTRLVPSDGRISLQPGPEAQDRHGRLLAHVSADDRDLAAELLLLGLARVAVVPPNDRMAACLLAVERSARQSQLGLWQIPVPEYGPDMRQGFVLVRGQLIRSAWQADGRWFGELSGGLWLTAYPESLAAFPDLVDAPLGGTVEVRGWLSRGTRPRLIIRHPIQMIAVPEPRSDPGL